MITTAGAWKKLHGEFQTIQNWQRQNIGKHEEARKKATEAVRDAFANLNQDADTSSLKDRLIELLEDKNKITVEVLNEAGKLIRKQDEYYSTQQTDAILAKVQVANEADRAEGEQLNKALERTVSSVNQLNENIEKTRVRASETNEVIKKVQDQIEELEASYKQLQSDVANSPGLLSMFAQMFNSVISRLSDESPQDCAKDWKKLVKLLLRDEIPLIKQYKLHVLEDLKKDESVRILFYKEVLEYIIGAISQRKMALQKKCQNEKKVKKEINELNQSFLNYYTLYSKDYVPHLFLPRPAEFLIEKSYADLGYSKWYKLQELLQELFKSDQVKSWNIPFIIFEIIQKNAPNLVDWLERHPRSAAIMASDLALVRSIFGSENFLSRLQKSFQAHTFTLAFLDAMGLCQVEPIAEESDLRFKALVDYIAHLPLAMTLIMNLNDGFTIKTALNMGKDVLLNKIFQKLNRQVDPSVLKNADRALAILRGEDWKTILKQERDYRFMQTAGMIKQALQRPDDLFQFLQKFWLTWRETISQAHGKEKVTRIIVQVVIPVIGILPATAYLVTLVAGAYFSLWTFLSLFFGINNITIATATLLYRYLNWQNPETLNKAENNVKKKIFMGLPEKRQHFEQSTIKTMLQQHVNEEVKTLQKYYQLPSIPRIYQNKTEHCKHALLIETMEKYFVDQLNSEVNVEEDLKTFNDVVVMKDIHTLLMQFVEKAMMKQSLSEKKDPLSQLILDYVLELEQSNQEMTFNEIDEIVCVLVDRLINKWLKIKMILHWESSLESKKSIQNSKIDKKTRQIFQEEGLGLHYSYLFNSV